MCAFAVCVGGCVCRVMFVDWCVFVVWMARVVCCLLSVIWCGVCRMVVDVCMIDA